MDGPMSYTKKGFFAGLGLGLLLSVFCILFVWGCKFAFNPGGGDIVGGFCKTVSIFYAPFLILFIFTAFSLIFHIIPSAILIIVFSGIGALIGRRFDKKQQKNELSRKTIITFLVITICFYVLVLFSTLALFFDRKDYLFDLWTEHKNIENFREEVSFLEPSYLPQGLEKIYIDNDIYVVSRRTPDDIRVHHIYRCEKEGGRRITLKISGLKLEKKQEGSGGNRQGRIEESVSINDAVGVFAYYDQDTEVDDWTFNKYTKPSRKLSWSVNNLYVTIENSLDAACVYSKEELIKIAESIK